MSELTGGKSLAPPRRFERPTNALGKRSPRSGAEPNAAPAADSEASGDTTLPSVPGESEGSGQEPAVLCRGCEASRTPTAFADALISLAANCGGAP